MSENIFKETSEEIKKQERADLPEGIKKAKGKEWFNWSQLNSEGKLKVSIDHGNLPGHSRSCNIEYTEHSGFIKIEKSGRTFSFNKGSYEKLASLLEQVDGVVHRELEGESYEEIEIGEPVAFAKKLYEKFDDNQNPNFYYWDEDGEKINPY